MCHHFKLAVIKCHLYKLVEIKCHHLMLSTKCYYVPVKIVGGVTHICNVLIFFGTVIDKLSFIIETEILLFKGFSQVNNIYSYRED